ncbi:MAG: teneurin-3 [Lachnospiraceae bacterium]|nr:teneurin-3 [Lachnospiraceae bacterium]
MSRRTSESSKAIRAAWQKEQELVSEGKGTRDWTPEQQKEILELGKAYYHSEDPDDVNDGKAFEGHHMKSAEAYPEYQGDPENIQFLSRTEHQEAHGGDYRNPTNGYFDPVTKTTRDFGNNKYALCKIIELSNPVVSTSDVVYGQQETTEASLKEGENLREDNPLPKKTSATTASPIKFSPKTSRSFGEKIMDTVEAVKGFSASHPVLTGVLKFVGVIAVLVRAEAIANSNRSSGGGSELSSLDDYSSSSSNDGYTDSLDADISGDSLSGRDYPDERSSPEEHTVSAHAQHYHTKNGVILKEKEPYQRGGKHDEDRS